jgi:hypothetical protein
MSSSTEITRGAGSKDKHQNGQSHKEELNMILLNFRKGGKNAEKICFHSSPSVEWIGCLLPSDYPTPGYKGDYKDCLKQN